MFVFFQDYLEKFYQLPKYRHPSERKKSASVIVEKLKEMQRFFGLNVTGKQDEETLKTMQKARCGVPDSGNFMLTPGHPKWKHTNLTYRIINQTTNLTNDVVERYIEEAFQLWKNASSLNITRVLQGEADIKIAFFQRDHGDNSPFDGPNGILAHAFQPGPGIGGDVHFDAEEMWTNTSKVHLEPFTTHACVADYNLYLVAAHEFGHSLGLSHSTDPGALMYPTYSFHEPSTYVLPQDDINGIQAIYGPADRPVQPTGPTTPTACDPRLTFDAVTTLRGEILFFKDKYFWRKHPQVRRVELNFISLFWPTLPDGIQAAYEDFYRDVVIVFKGNHLRYDDQRQSMDPGYPKSIASTFQGIGSRVDAVFQRDDVFFFFSGPIHYAFDFRYQRITKVERNNRWLNCRYG
ncbi:Neutrophil collagenase [Camelus dromedarius]|uniref:Neutrophil collagenase n=1 Tax=Camelus dromedarius TaxID=9838 RepID=A0A5N4DPA1_CAMDR|nr:Neutrophil collagenase [Camelus dromedarius]